MNAERHQWIRYLSALADEELLAWAQRVPSEWRIRPKAVPQSGLGMLKLRDGAFHEPFYLGEFPLATAWLSIRTAQGQEAEGAASVMDDRLDVAQALALADAVLSARLPGWQEVLALLEKGRALCEQTERRRKLMLKRTQVDFSLLEEAEGDDAQA